MEKYRIEGGFPIKGRIKASGNKNSALPCIAATLLTDEEVILHNIPEIEDVHVLLKILSGLGSTVKSVGPGSYCIQTHNITKSDVPFEEAKKIRASILLAGPLVARTGHVHMPPPGGDVIGRRRLDTHFLALTRLGAQIQVDGMYRIHANKLVGAEIFLDEASVTATENAIMAAALADGTTVIENAASEPHVQDLCNLICAMGGVIEGVGSNILTIHGTRKLAGAQFTIGSDFMEVGSFIGMAAITKGDVTIENANPRHLRMAKLNFAKLGIHWEEDGDAIRVPPGQRLQVVPDIGGMIPKIDDAPWPGFPPDLISIMATVATQVAGTVLVHEKMYESRMFFVDKLIVMGAKIILCDPHRAVVSGASRLHGTELVSPDVRAGMAMVLAALCADGTSEIQNIYQIERGYENITARLHSLGARIERIDA